ncbi:hypothetical protein COCON_G00190880 [Conger conger]|uniref:Uncharacterized protein n=1 Tax=Conger conger TaxID=82655 RepID=A0A9Q1HQD1_CONCO|nr:hypothetical protein COCON_G00190880 [Conger conger]
MTSLNGENHQDYISNNATHLQDLMCLSTALGNVSVQTVHIHRVVNHSVRSMEILQEYRYRP